MVSTFTFARGGIGAKLIKGLDEYDAYVELLKEDRASPSFGMPTFPSIMRNALSSAEDWHNLFKAQLELVSRGVEDLKDLPRPIDEGQNVGEKKLKSLKRNHSDLSCPSGLCIDDSDTWDHATFRMWITDHPVFSVLLPGLPLHVTPEMLNGEFVAKYWIESWGDVQLQPLAAACVRALSSN